MDRPGRLARRGRCAGRGHPPGAAARPHLHPRRALCRRDGGMTQLTTCQEAEAVAARAAAFVRREIDRARAERGTAHIALSGGTTPARTYELLGADGGDWTGVQVWFADERCVPPDDQESNYRLAAEKLLRPAE